MIRRDFVKTAAAVAVLPFLGGGGRVKGDYRMAAVTNEGEFLWYPGVYRPTISNNQQRFEFRGELEISRKVVVVGSAITDHENNLLAMSHYSGGPFTVNRGNKLTNLHTLKGEEALGHPEMVKQAKQRMELVKWR